MASKRRPIRNPSKARAIGQAKHVAKPTRKAKRTVAGARARRAATRTPGKGSPRSETSAGKYIYHHVGIVPLETGTIAAPSSNVPLALLERARPHVNKFHFPGDAVNVTATSGNGTILYTAQLRLIFWGLEWAANPPASMADVASDVQTILAGPYLLSLLQYGVSGATLDRVIDLSHEDPPNPVGDDNILDLAGRLIDQGVVPEPDQDLVPAVYAIFLPAHVQGNPLTHPVARGAHGFVSNIDWDDFNYAYVPVMWIGNEGTCNGITQVFSHELVETLTDPEGDSWLIEPRDRNPPQEIADVCKTVQSGLQSYWSNEDQACIVPVRAYTTYAVQWIWRPRRIEWLGGVDEDQVAWQLPRQAVMDRIRAGDRFLVNGPGKSAFVSILYLDATHPYLATVPDGSPDDNLLALPQRAPS
jgi:Protein of unknown function (DUF3892)